MTTFEIWTIIELGLFLIAVYMCRKDFLLLELSFLFALIHFFNIPYHPSGVGPTSFLLESIVCLVLGYVTVAHSIRAWAVAIGIIMISSIALILFEFIDWAINSSKLTDTWLLWIHIITLLEIAIFMMAPNGYFQFYGSDSIDGGGRGYRDDSSYFNVENNWKAD
jgi:hypothetical protein